MQIKDRIKQAASINDVGQIIFGAALEGHYAVELETERSDNFQYLLEDGSGGFELGLYNQIWYPTTLSMNAYRVVTSSNVGSNGSGFEYGTTGLTLSIVQTAGMSSSHSSQNPAGPRTAGFACLAVGPASEALHNYSTAIGVESRTVFSGETAIGFSWACYPSWVSVGAVANAGGSSFIKCGVEWTNELAFIVGQIRGKGVLRITGTLTATDADTESAANTNVYDVSIILTDIGGVLAALGTPSFTPLVAGSGVSGLSFSYSGGKISVENIGANNYIVNGLLHLHWIATNYWW